MMPDISMCMNVSCPSRATCYRYLAVPTPLRQCYGSFQPNDELKCDRYAHHDGSRKTRPLEDSDAANNKALLQHKAKAQPCCHGMYVDGICECGTVESS
jgi:hypothetical protein